MKFDHRGLDGLFEIEPGIVTAVVGKAATGKTSLCLSLARSAEKPYLIDTEGVSLNRIKQIGVEKLRVARVRDFRLQEKLILDLKLDADLLIVDSFVMLYRLKLMEDHNRANAMLARQISALHAVSEENEIPVIVTGHVYSTEDGDKIVGGDIMKYWAKSILHLEKTGLGTRKATLVKHRSLPEGKSCRFRLCDRGVC